MLHTSSDLTNRFLFLCLLLTPLSNAAPLSFSEETLNNNNGPVSPPHNNSFNPGPQQQPALPHHLQRENMQITQPCSPSSSPLASPNALNLGHFQLPSSSTVNLIRSSLSSGGSSHSHPAIGLALVNSTDTADPNWQANKGSVRERNAAMFNNDLMADIKFVVGADGE